MNLTGLLKLPPFQVRKLDWRNGIRSTLLNVAKTLPIVSFSLRGRLLLLVLLAVIPAFGLIFYEAWEERLRAAADAKEKALNLTRSVLQEQRQFVGKTRRFLTHLAQLPEIKSADPTVCSAFVAGRLAESSEYANLGVISSDGNLICSALPFKGPINVSDRLYFRRTVETQDFSIGEYQIGRVTKKATLNFGYPVLDDKGKFRGVVFAGLDLAWLSHLVAQAQLPPGSVLTVVDQKGTILARSRESETWAEKTMPQAPLVKAILTEKSQSTVEVPGLDGIDRLYAVSPLRVSGQAGVHVAVGIPMSVAYAEANRALVRNLLSLGLVTLLALMAAWYGGDLFILRPVNALVNATKQLASGDLSARTGHTYASGELGQLARSFDAMAESNERRYRELQALRDIDLGILSILDLRTVLEILLEKIDLHLPYAATSIRLLDAQTGKLEMIASRNIPAVVAEVKSGRITRSLPDLALEYRAPLVIANVEREAQTSDREALIRQGLVSYLGIPLVVKGEVLGVLSFYTREEHQFSSEEMEFLTTLGGQAAIAIHNSKLYEDTKTQALELAKSNKVKTEFLGVMSHELRTPLIAIMGYAGLMEDEVLGKNSLEQAKAVRVIRKRADDLLVMIRGILEATKIEAGSVMVEQEEVDFRTLFDDLRESYIAPLDKQVTLRWDYESDLPVAKTDGGKLRQILQNLINNAMKFTHQGEVIISAKYVREARCVQVRVTDTGIGIPEEMRSVIFEKFRQLDSSDIRLYEGVGLGLYIVKQFTELLGGAVGVDSTPGEGSVFTVTFPC